MIKKTACLVALVNSLVACGTEPAPELIVIANGQGEIAGEVTANSVILQSRLTTATVLVDGDVPGAPGVARFELATSNDFSDVIESPWLEATAARDFIVKIRMDGLSPGTRHYYRLRYGPRENHTQLGPTRSFSTSRSITGSIGSPLLPNSKEW